MGKLIKFRFTNPQKDELRHNLKQLKMLIDWPLPNDKEVFRKIKKEQLNHKI